ncbi:MAG TPA: thioredoxin domain-containing protein [Kofleriaceae bacterium]|nr:thioredoxin domain-containing protein [Kofleriaceae bacterium]
MAAHRVKTRILLGIAGALAVQHAAAQKPEPAERGKIVTVVHSPPDQVPSLGPRNAPVTIEFFANLGDGSASGLVHSLLTKLLERHPRRLRILYRLVSGGEQSNPHLEAALEAFAQGRFRQFVDAMYGEALRSPRVADLPAIAVKAGVQADRLEQALEDGRHAAAVVANHHYRKRRRVRRSPPQLLINGVPYDRRPRTLDELESLYDEAYARGIALRDQGVPADQVYERLLAQVTAEQPDPIVGPGAVDGLGPGERPPLGNPPLMAARLDRGGHHRGPDGAPITIVFLCNFQTRNCGETAAILDEITAAYPDEVRLVFRHFFDPSDPRQDGARSLHRAALCADQQARFWNFYELAFRQARRGVPETAADDELARELELDGRAFKRCLRSRRVKGLLEAERRRAARAGVRHTPSLVLGGRLFTGTKSFDELAALVDRELSPGVLGRIAPE